MIRTSTRHDTTQVYLKFLIIVDFLISATTKQTHECGQGDNKQVRCNQADLHVFALSLSTFFFRQQSFFLSFSLSFVRSFVLDSLDAINDKLKVNTSISFLSTQKKINYVQNFFYAD